MDINKDKDQVQKNTELWPPGEMSVCGLSSRLSLLLFIHVVMLIYHHVGTQGLNKSSGIDLDYQTLTQDSLLSHTSYWPVRNKRHKLFKMIVLSPGQHYFGIPQLHTNGHLVSS